jgi:hypothetical protein
MRRLVVMWTVLLALAAGAALSRADDWYELWLRHRPLPPLEAQGRAARATELVATERKPPGG